MPIYDALYDGGVEHILCRHETECCNGCYRYGVQHRDVAILTWQPQAQAPSAFSHSLADAFMDSIPLVAITGQVAISPLVPMHSKKWMVVCLCHVLNTVTSLPCEDLAPTLAGSIVVFFFFAKAGRRSVIVDIAKMFNSRVPL